MFSHASDQVEYYKKEMKKAETDVCLDAFFGQSIQRSIERLTPNVVTLLEKSLRKLEIRLIQERDRPPSWNDSIGPSRNGGWHSAAAGSMGLGNSKSAQPGQLGKYAGIYEGGPSSEDLQVRRLTESSPERFFGQRSEFTPEGQMDKQSAAARRSELLYINTMPSLEKENLKLIREMDESISDTKSDPCTTNQDYHKGAYQNQGQQTQSHRSAVQSSSSDPYNLIDKAEMGNAVSSSASKSGPSGARASFLYRDPHHSARIRLEKKRVQNRIREEIKPIFQEFQKAICNDLNVDFPYLTSVVHQLSIIQENSEETRAQLQGLQPKERQSLQVTIYPIETKHITEYNKKLLKENEALTSKYRQVLEQIQTMRTNFNRELNNRTTLEDQQQRKLKAYHDRGMFGSVHGEDMDLTQIKFFDATDGLDPETGKILEYRINQLKEKFAGWKIKQIDYVEELSRKLHLYQNISSQFHGLINMPLEEIVQGLSLFDESPDTLWDMIVKHFSDQFFMPVIDKRYGHLFVNDTQRQQESMKDVIKQTVDNERIVRAQCENQLKQLKYEKEQAEEEVLKLRSTMQQAIRTAEETSYYEGDQYGKELQAKEISDLKKRIEDSEKENDLLKLETRDVQQAREQEQMKTMFIRMVAFTKAKQAYDLKHIEDQIREIPSVLTHNKVIDFIAGRTNSKFEIELSQLKQKLREQEDLNVQLILETNTMKRQWKRLEEERKYYRDEYEHHQAEHMTHRNACQAQQQRFQSYNLQMQLMETNLKEQGILLDAVEKERDKAVKDMHIAVRSRGHVNMGNSKASQMDQYTKATKCIIAFNGWKNFYELGKVNHNHKDKETITVIRNLQHDVVQVNQPKVKEAKKATDEELAVIRDLPLVERGMQTDPDEFNAYLSSLGANFGRKLARKGTMSKIVVGDTEKEAGTNCRMLDSEQVNCFIFDSLCNDKYLQKIIEEKRKYEIVTDYEDGTLGDEQSVGQDQGAIGGIKMKSKGEKLPEAQRIQIRNKVNSIQEGLGISKHKQMHYPELQGVYKRLWQDAGLKDERMYHLRCQIDQLIKEQLEKKIHLQKNSNNDQLFKNSLLLNGFLEQIRLFINRTINPPELMDKMQDVKDLVLEGQAQLLSPRKSTSSPRQSSPQQKKEVETNNFRLQFREKLSEEQVYAVCRFYIDKLKLILKKRKYYVRQARIASPDKEIYTSNVKLVNEMMMVEKEQQNLIDIKSDEKASLLQKMDQRKTSEQRKHVILDTKHDYQAYKSGLGRDPMKDSITDQTYNTVTGSQTHKNHRTASGVVRTNGDMTQVLSSKNISAKMSTRMSNELKTKENDAHQDSITYDNQPKSSNMRNQELGNELQILRSKYETELLSKETNELLDQQMSPPDLQSNIQFATKDNESSEDGRNLNPRQSITRSANVAQEDNGEELKQRIEQEASANNLNFNFSRGRATVFTNPLNPEPFYTRSDSLGITKVGLRYPHHPDTTKSQNSGSKPTPNIAKTTTGGRKQRKKSSHDKASLFHPHQQSQTRISDNHRLNSNDAANFNLNDNNHRASTAYGHRKITKPYDDQKFGLKCVETTEHLRQYSNSYLRSMGQPNQNTESHEIDMYEEREPLSAELKKFGSNSALGATITASSKHLFTNKEGLTTQGDQYSSEYAPTRCESAVKGNQLINRAVDQWKFSHLEPKESSMPNEKFLQNLHHNQRIKKERLLARGNKTSSISLAGGNIGSRETKANRRLQSAVRPKLQVAAGGGGFSTTAIHSQLGYKSQPKMSLININNLKKNKMIDRSGKLNGSGKTKDFERALQITKSLKSGAGNSTYNSAQNLKQTNNLSQGTMQVYSNLSPQQQYKSPQNTNFGNPGAANRINLSAGKILSSLSPTGKSFIGNQIRAKHRASGAAAEYRDQSSGTQSCQSISTHDRPEISIVGQKSSFAESRANKNQQIQQANMILGKQEPFGTRIHSGPNHNQIINVKSLQ